VADAEWVEISAIKPWDRNPRKNAAAIDEVAGSIKRFGFSSPIIVRRADGVIIAGHTRYAASQRLGLDKVLVRYMDLDPAQARALALADNKLGELADWDAPLLAEVLRELNDEDVSLEGLGFDAQELDAILPDLDALDDAFADALGALPEGDQSSVRKMTFILHSEQLETVKRALEHAKSIGDFIDTGNDNKNGNALARVCELLLTHEGA
jgi:ParB-like chromosome segregation protein Spo0J